MRIPSVLTLSGRVRLLTPLAISLHTNPKSATDPTPVPHTMVRDPDTGALVETGCVLSSSVRGALRRCALQSARYAIAASGGNAQLALKSYYMNAIGGTRDKGKDAISYDATTGVEVREGNPLLSVFGAADTGRTYFLGSKLSIDHLLPLRPLPPDSCPVFPGVRVDDMKRSAEATLESLEPGADAVWRALVVQTRGTSQSKQRDKEIGRAMRAAERSGRTEEVARLKEERNAQKESLKTSPTSINMPLAGYRALPTGLELAFRLDLRNPTDVETGVLFAALELWAFDPMLGGHRAHGCGRVALEATATLRRLGSGVEQLGVVKIDGSGGFSMPDSGYLADALTAYRRAAPAFDLHYHQSEADDGDDAEAEGE